LLSLSGAGCAFDSQTATFDYTPAIRDEIVVPILEKQLAGLLVNYNPDKPNIDVVKEKVVLFFDWDFAKGGINVLDPPRVIIVLYRRTLKICAVHNDPSYILLPDAVLLGCR
jgi:hypothetical protein